jgi:hypothetical protein
MSTNWLELDFGGGDVEKGQLPGAVAHIVVKHMKDVDGEPVYLSHQCVGPNELRWEAGRLKDELDEILAKGERAFRDYQSTTRAAIERKHARKLSVDTERKDPSPARVLFMNNDPRRLMPQPSRMHSAVVTTFPGKSGGAGRDSCLHPVRRRGKEGALAADPVCGNCTFTPLAVDAFNVYDRGNPEEIRLSIQALF